MTRMKSDMESDTNYTEPLIYNATQRVSTNYEEVTTLNLDDPDAGYTYASSACILV